MDSPPDTDLTGRNVVIAFLDNIIRIRNDWLGSIPIFYNKKYRVVSTLFCKTLVDKEYSIHPEGLNNYLDFGYSVLEQTPVKEIKFLRYYSEIILSNTNLEIKYYKDPFLEDLNKQNTSVDQIISLIREYIDKNDKIIHGDVIIPTSGGFDSRLLNLLYPNKKRIKSFSYGISHNQLESFETVRAKKLSEILNIQWEQIELGQFNKFYLEWFFLYGLSTHLHGMYFIEFFKKIRNKIISRENSVLSGIFGDAWSGNVIPPTIKNPNGLSLLSYSHGIAVNHKEVSLAPEENLLKKNFFLANKEFFAREDFRIVTLIRMKIILISLLLTIPEYFGFPAWSPFLSMKIAGGILSLPPDIRKNRKWQKDFFKKMGVYLEDLQLHVSFANELDLISLKYEIIPPIKNIDKLSTIFRNEFLVRLNKEYSNLIKELKINNTNSHFFKNSFLTKMKKFYFYESFRNFLKKYSKFHFENLFIRKKKPLYNLYLIKPFDLFLQQNKLK